MSTQFLSENSMYLGPPGITRLRSRGNTKIHFGGIISEVGVQWRVFVVTLAKSSVP
jgi:hypothetical protein